MFNWLLENRALWEQPVLDLWAITHFLSGVLIALIIRGKRIKIWIGFLISLVVSIIWEIFEIILDISKVEYVSNQIADVIFAQIGFWTGIVLFRRISKNGTIASVTSVLVGIFIAIVLLGWFAYRNYAVGF